MLSVHGLSFPQEVEGVLNESAVGSLVDEDFTHIGQEGESDAAGHILLVVKHKGVKAVVVIASDGRTAVGAENETRGRVEHIGGKSHLCSAHKEFAHQSPSHSSGVRDVGSQ